MPTATQPGPRIGVIANSKRAAEASAAQRAVAAAWAWVSAACPRARTRVDRRGRAAGTPCLREGTISVGRQMRVDVDSAARLSADHGLASLADALRHPEPTTRARAVAVISELVSTRAGALLRTMIHDPCADVRRAVARAAVRVGTTDVVASLIVALADPDADVRAAAAEAVTRVTGCHVAPPTASVDAEEIDAVKRWWREKRSAELLRSMRQGVG